MNVPSNSRHYLNFYNCGFVGNTVYCCGEPYYGLKFDYYYFYNCITNGKTYPTSVPNNSSNTLWKNVTSGTINGAPVCTVSNCRTDGVASATGFTVNTNTSTYEPYAQNMMIPDEYQIDSIDSSFHSTLNLTLNNTIFDTNPSVGTWRCATQGWIKDPTSNGEVSIIDNTGISLTSGDNVAVLSPVMKFSLGLNLNGFSLTATEYSGGGVGQVLDSDPADATRTIQFRYANYPFTQTQTSQAPAWQNYTRKTALSGITCKYLQLRIVFQMSAAV